MTRIYVNLCWFVWNSLDLCCIMPAVRQACQLLSYVHVQNDNYALAEQVLKNNLKFHPQDTSTFNNLGAAHQCSSFLSRVCGFWTR